MKIYSTFGGKYITHNKIREIQMDLIEKTPLSKGKIETLDTILNYFCNKIINKDCK